MAPSPRATSDPHGAADVGGALNDAAQEPATERSVDPLGPLSGIHDILTRVDGESELLAQVCDQIVHAGHCSSAWYARPGSDDTVTPEMVSCAGVPPDEPLQAQVPMPWSDAWEPAWSERPPIHRVGAGAPRWALVQPVTVDGSLDGALVLLADARSDVEPGFVGLLGPVTDHLAMALGSMRRQREIDDTVKQLGVQEDRLTSVLDAMIDPFVLFEAVRDSSGALVDLRYVAANEVAGRYNRLTREQMIGTRLLEVFPGQLEHGPLRQYFRTIETGEPTVLDDYAYPHEIIAEERYYDIRATKAGDGLALTWRDVTDRHRTVQRIADSERLYRLLADNSSDVIILSEDGRTFSWVSESAESVLGCPPAQLVGRSLAYYVHPDDLPELVTEIVSSERTGEVARLRSRWRLPDGSYCWVESAGRPIHGPGDPGEGRVISIHRVDDQVAADQQLAESEHLYRLLTENTSDVVLMVDQALTIRWISPAVTGLLLWEPSDLVGHPATDFIHPDDVPGLRAVIARADELGTDSQYRYRWRRADGGWRWVEGRGRRVETHRDIQGRVVRLRDVEDQVAAEQELAASEELYRLIAENSTDIIVLADRDGRAVWTSPAMERNLGWTDDDMIGRLGAEFIHPDDVPGMIAALRRSVETGTDARLRYRMRAKDGVYHWFDASGRTLAPNEADPGSIRRVVRLRNIDDQVEAEVRLANSENTYRVLAENASDVVWQVADDGTVLWVSPSVSAVLGWEADAVVGRPITGLIDPADRPRFDEGVQALARGQAMLGEFRVTAPDGSSRWMEVSLRTARADDHAARIGTLRDIDDVV